MCSSDLQLTALPGLAAITTGSLTVSAPVFTTKTVTTVVANATTTAAAAPTDESTSGATDVKPAMGAIATVMAAVPGEIPPGGLPKGAEPPPPTNVAKVSRLVGAAPALCYAEEAANASGGVAALQAYAACADGTKYTNIGGESAFQYNVQVSSLAMIELET